MITPTQIQQVVQRIALGYQPERVLLFGSYATGQATDDSDVDLLVIKDTALPRPHRGREVRRWLYGSGVPLDILVYTPQEFEAERLQPHSLVSSALSSSQTLYERR